VLFLSHKTTAHCSGSGQYSLAALTKADNPRKKEEASIPFTVISSDRQACQFYLLLHVIAKKICMVSIRHDSCLDSASLYSSLVFFSSS